MIIGDIKRFLGHSFPPGTDLFLISIGGLARPKGAWPVFQTTGFQPFSLSVGG